MDGNFLHISRYKTLYYTHFPAASSLEDANPLVNLQHKGSAQLALLPSI